MPTTKSSPDSKSTRKPSMVRLLTELVKKKKVMVFIDGSNLYYMMYKTRARFNYDTFASWMKSKSNLIDIHYYTAFDPDEEKQMDFLQDLEDHNYTIHKKPIKWVIDHHKGNMDVELAVDAISLAPNYDLMFLLSGDGDFTYLCQTLEKMGKKTIVASLGGYTAQELHESADNYFFLERISTIWKKSYQKQDSTKKSANLQNDDSSNDIAPEVQTEKPEKPSKKTVRSTKKSASENIPKIYI
jgi:uncharacterized LabA/DUF88 family protein